MDILDFSPLLIIIEILVYTWSFRGGGEGKEEHYVCTILVSSLFLIYSKISSLLLYFLTFVIPLIFIAQLSHFLPFSKKITFLLSFFFFFFAYHLIDFCYYPSRIFFDRGRKLGGKACTSVRIIFDSIIANK